MQEFINLLIALGSAALIVVFIGAVLAIVAHWEDKGM